MIVRSVHLFPLPVFEPPVGSGEAAATAVP